MKAMTLLAAGALAVLVQQASAETLVENSYETRFQLDLKVPDAALASYLPAGWMPNVATQGAAKDCNLRCVFIDRVTINGPDGKPVGKGSNRLVYLVAPVKDPAGENAQLVIGGLTEEPTDAPGPFGVYLLATTHTMQRNTSSGGSGPILDSQDWVFGAANGERLEMHIKKIRAPTLTHNPRPPNRPRFANFFGVLVLLAFLAVQSGCPRSRVAECTSDAFLRSPGRGFSPTSNRARRFVPGRMTLPCRW